MLLDKCVCVMWVCVIIGNTTIVLTHACEHFAIPSLLKSKLWTDALIALLFCDTSTFPKYPAYHNVTPACEKLRRVKRNMQRQRRHKRICCFCWRALLVRSRSEVFAAARKPCVYCGRGLRRCVHYGARVDRLHSEHVTQRWTRAMRLCTHVSFSQHAGSRSSRLCKQTSFIIYEEGTKQICRREPNSLERRAIAEAT